VLVIDCRELFKFEVGRAGPVETLFRELVLVSVSDTKTQVIVLLEAFNATPEEQLLEIALIRSVE